MKDKYDAAEIELIKFEACDILTVSGEGENQGGDEGDDGWE